MKRHLIWWRRLVNAYRNLWESICTYWANYGGLSALIISPYLHISIIISIILYPIWSVKGWEQYVLQILPNIVGFSVGSYAILLSFGDPKFFRILMSESEQEKSVYLALNGTFVHFVVVQILAIVAAVGCEAYVQDHPGLFGHLISFFGFSLFVYSLFMVLAAVLALLRVARWYERYRPGSDDNGDM
jgi:hypothetical protein